MTFLALVVIAGVYNPLSHTRHCFDLLTASNKYLSYIGSVKKYILCYQILCSNCTLITKYYEHQFNAFTEPENMIIRREVTCYKAMVAKISTVSTIIMTRSIIIIDSSNTRKLRLKFTFSYGRHDL